MLDFFFYSRGLSNIYVYFPNEENNNFKGEFFLKHITTDLMILFGNLYLFFVAISNNNVDHPIPTKHHILITKTIWISYGFSLFFKIVFYLFLHPWSAIIRHDIFSKNRNLCVFEHAKDEPSYCNHDQKSLLLHKDNVSLPYI